MSDTPSILPVKPAKTGGAPKKTRKDKGGADFAKALSLVALTNLGQSRPAPAGKAGNADVSGKATDRKTAAGKNQTRAATGKLAVISGDAGKTRSKSEAAGSARSAGSAGTSLEVKASKTGADPDRSRVARRANSKSPNLIRLVEPARTVKTALAPDAGLKARVTAAETGKGAVRGKPSQAQAMSRDLTGPSADSRGAEADRVTVKVRDRNARSEILLPRFAREGGPRNDGPKARQPGAGESPNIIKVAPEAVSARARGENIQSLNQPAADSKGKARKEAGAVSKTKAAAPAGKSAAKSSAPAPDGRVAESAAKTTKENKSIFVPADTRWQAGTASRPGTTGKAPSTPPRAAFSELARNVGGQVIRSITYLAGGESKEMLVRLEPPELGRLQLKLVIAGGELSARMVVDSPRVKEMVEAQLPQLRQGLQDQGFVVGKLLVETRSQGQTPFRDGRNGSADSDGKTGSDGRPDADIAAKGIVEGPAVRILDPGRIDYLA